MEANAAELQKFREGEYGFDHNEMDPRIEAE